MSKMSPLFFNGKQAFQALTAAGFVCAAVLSAKAEPLPSAAATNRPTVNVLLLGYYIWATPRYVELCEKEGIRIVGPMREDPTGADPSHYPLEFLKQFHVVVASGPLERPWDPQVIRTPIKPGIVASLLAYNRQGGGVVWTPLGAGRGADAWTETIGARIDAAALDEALNDPAKDVSVSLMSSFRDRLRYIWTTDIARHPVTDGVRGLFFGRTGEWGWPGTIPMRFGPSWTVLVRGMDSTRTTRNGNPPDSGTRDFAYTDKTGSYPSNPQLMAVREAQGDAKGRMMVQPIYTTWTWGNYGHPAMKDAFLFNGDGIYKSDGQRLLVNAWRWLAEPALAAGGFGGYQPPAKAESEKTVDLSPVAWKDVDWSTIQSGPEVHGIFGAQSRWGGGSGTVEEWAAAARAAGLDFIVFTDDPGLHTPDTYAALVAACKRNSSAGFAVVPGIGCEDVNGIFRFFPDAPTLPHRKHFNAQGRMTEPAGIAVDYAWTVGQVAAGLGKMPYNPWWEHVIMACAPLTYEDTTLTDDGVLRWLRCCEAHQTTLLPLSLVRVKSPDRLAAAAKAAHLSVLRTGDPGDIRSFARTGVGGQVMPSYLTSGPRIPVWTKESAPFEPFRPNSSRFRIMLKATSEEGLAEVRLIDAADGSDYRVWKPSGQKTFTATIDEQTGNQRVLGLIVTDVNGRTAIAPPVYTFQGANRSWHMGDRLMGMHHTTSWDPARKRLVTHGTPAGISYHKGSPDGGGEFVTDHVADLKFQGLEGSGIYPPAFKLNPLLDTDRGREPASCAMRFEQRLAGHDLAVFDYVGDQEYAEGGRFDFNATPRIARDTRIATTVSRNWLIRTRYRAPVVMMVNEIAVTFKQDVLLKRLSLGRYHGPDVTGEFNFLVIKPGTNQTAEAWDFEAGEKFSRTTEFTPGGYLYQAKALAGTMGFVALDDKVACESQARAHTFVLQKRHLRNYRAGETLRVRMLRVSRAYEAQQGSSAWLEQFLRDYGVACEPAYTYTLLQGALDGINYVMDLKQQDGGAAVALGKYDLPEPLPVRVSGVRKTAALGEYDLDTLRVRPLPFFEGTVTTSVETQLRATRLYVGEWLSWNSEAARVSLVTDGTDFLLEAHNPTAAEIVCAFTGAPGFAPLKDYRKELRIAPYSSVKERLPSAAGTVKLEPMR